MARYIDVDEYIKYCDEHWIPLNVDAVNAQPTADVVEVVRCKDCDYSMGITEKKCPVWENIGDPNGYCKWCDQQLSSINER